MTTYTNDQLKQALAKMLPEQLLWDEPFNRLHWVEDNRVLWPEVKDTELLHICWLIEQALTEKEDVWFLQRLSQQRYLDGECGTIGTLIDRSVHATWQQRTIALAKVKGIEI